MLTPSFIASSVESFLAMPAENAPTKASPAPVVSTALTSGASILITSLFDTNAAPLLPKVTIKLLLIFLENSIKFLSSKAVHPAIVSNSISFGINQSVTFKRLSLGIFAGAGFNIV